MRATRHTVWSQWPDLEVPKGLQMALIREISSTLNHYR